MKRNLFLVTTSCLVLFVITFSSLYNIHFSDTNPITANIDACASPANFKGAAEVELIARQIEKDVIIDNEYWHVLYEERTTVKCKGEGNIGCLVGEVKGEIKQKLYRIYL